MKKLIPILALALMLGGCSSWNFNDYEQYADTISSHSTSEATRISAQSDAIAKAAHVEGTTKTEAVLLAAIAMMQIERLQPVPLGIAKPTTGYDVLQTAVGHLPFAFSTYGMYRLGVAGIENAGAISLNAEQIETSDSFNRSDVRSVGEANSATISNARDESVTDDHSITE